MSATSKRTPTCGVCHQSKAKIEIEEDGKKYIRSHKCSGIQCNDPKCGYVRGHPELRDAIKAKARAEKQAAKAKKTAAKLEQDERQSLLAGMKPPTTTNFKTIMEQTFSKAHLGSKSSPGPANLHVLVDAIRGYSSSQRPPPPPRKKPKQQTHPPSPLRSSQSSSDPSSFNAVVHLLESGESPIKKKQWQCRHCSFLQLNNTGSNMQERGECEMCSLHMVSQARPDAVTSPAILRHALAIRDTVASSPVVATVPDPTHRPYPRPVVWPYLKKCDICKDLQAQRYCSSCHQYVCSSEACTAILHDTEAIRIHMCRDEDIYLITTRSGRTTSAPTDNLYINDTTDVEQSDHDDDNDDEEDEDEDVGISQEEAQPTESQTQHDIVTSSSALRSNSPVIVSDDDDFPNISDVEDIEIVDLPKVEPSHNSSHTLKNASSQTDLSLPSYVQLLPAINPSTTSPAPKWSAHKKRSRSSHSDQENESASSFNISSHSQPTLSKNRL